MKPGLTLSLAAVVLGLALAPAPPAFARSHRYTNDYGRQVKSPKRSLFGFLGSSAKCRDGASSYSRSRSGACSGHGGVRKFR